MFIKGMCYYKFMFTLWKKDLNKELKKLTAEINKKYSLRKLSPLLFNSLKNYILRDGKRLRPVLFILGYKGFSGKNPKNLYRSALATELLHDFLLVHDDIIDKSDLRRGGPSMHAMLNMRLGKNRNKCFKGEDLAIVAGDILFAIAAEIFFSIDVNHEYKEKAFIKFAKSACYTGCGEFIEILYNAKDIKKITENDIYKIYDYKTAWYTFASPLSEGAVLAGASDSEADSLCQYGIYLGRAFQIKDDILGLFGKEKETGKPSLSDLQESKKTLLMWHTYKNASKSEKIQLEEILSAGNVKYKDLIIARKIVKKTGALDFAERKIEELLGKSAQILKRSRMKKHYKDQLIAYSERILLA